MSRIAGRRKLKIGKKKAHDTGDLRSHLEVERSKVNVVRSQVKRASVLNRRPQLVAPPDE